MSRLPERDVFICLASVGSRKDAATPPLHRPVPTLQPGDSQSQRSSETNKKNLVSLHSNGTKSREDPEEGTLSKRTVSLNRFLVPGSTLVSVMVFISLNLTVDYKTAESGRGAQICVSELKGCKSLMICVDLRRKPQTLTEPSWRGFIYKAAKKKGANRNVLMKDRETLWFQHGCPK